MDLVGRTALLVKTKTERNSTRYLTDQLVARLYQLSEIAEPDARVFRYKCRHSVNERIQAVCKRAGLTYKPSHTCGRHAFANNTLAMGMDIKSIMDAGGWRSAAVFLGTYANPRNAGRVVADRHNLYLFENEL
ncbi:tyrosine-type recombinase/integrase [Neorhizobium sp. NCHU2750]|uniref:tyrosine-type recombinase/integrase n=1 Tax=Neorhizobium sp. NCHU2750 TaxID=1825976 RepID=UPI001FE0F64E